MKVKCKYKFKQIVKHQLGDDTYLIGAVSINEAGELLYGCDASAGNRVWFKEYELEGFPTRGRIGFTLELKHGPTKD